MTTRNAIRLGGRTPVRARGSNRVNEEAMAKAVRRILITRPKQAASYAELRDLIPKRVHLSLGDRAKSPTRPGEALWMQVLRNLSCHIENHDGFVRIPGGVRLRAEPARRAAADHPRHIAA